MDTNQKVVQTSKKFSQIESDGLGSAMAIKFWGQMKAPRHEGSMRLVGSEGPVCKGYGEQMPQHVEYTGRRS